MRQWFFIFRTIFGILFSSIFFIIGFLFSYCKGGFITGYNFAIKDDCFLDGMK